MIPLIPTSGQNVLRHRQAGNYGFFYRVYYYPGDLDDFMPFRFKAGTLQVSNAPISSICRLICDQSLKSIKEDLHRHNRYVPVISLYHDLNVLYQDPKDTTPADGRSYLIFVHLR